MSPWRVLVLPGDGIGQEVLPAAVEVLQALVPRTEVHWDEVGFAVFEEQGTALPDTVLQMARHVDGILFGATSSPSRRVEGYCSPILTLRQELGLCANIRPVRSWPVPGARPGVDLVIVRENCEGLYVREERWEEPDTAVALRRVSRRRSRWVAEVALRAAVQRARRRTSRRARITVVHKANVLTLTDGLFRETALQVLQRGGAETKGLHLVVEDMLVDAAALRLVRAPESFDVLVTPNLYGDILSDVAAGLIGGLGLAPSANLGKGPPLVEPVHGSAPDIAGKGIANPVAAMLSVGLLLEQWGLWEEARRLEAAVEAAFRAGVRTPDLGGTASTVAMTRAVLEYLT